MLRPLKSFTIVLLLVAVQAFGTIPLEDIKDLDQTNPGYEDLNPLHGLVWNEGIVENHGELLPESSALFKIIALLFHRTGTFDPSTQPDTNSVVPYLTQKKIGEILGALKNGKLEIDKIIKVSEGKDYAIARKYRNNLGTYLNELKNDSKAYKVMLALLWYKAKSKKDIEQYYEGVRTYKKDAIKNIPEGWVNAHFTFADAQSNLPPSIKTYDAYLYWIIKHQGNAPPLEHQGDAFIPERLSDCGETSLRNFLKLVSEENGRYSVAVLKALGAKQNVLDFFAEFSSREKQTTQEARDAWAKVTINLQGVLYKQNANGKKFEIRASSTDPSKNMLGVLRALFTELKEARDWEDVGKEVERARQNSGLGRFHIENSNLSSQGHGELIFSVQNLGRFKWFFQPTHFYVDALPSGEMGQYPRKDIHDIAVFYPVQQFPQLDTWYLYAQLRQNENIEFVLRALDIYRKLSTNILVGLLNRLTTDDAKKRVFGEIIDEKNLAELLNNKNFRPSEAYLYGLLDKKKFDLASKFATHKYFAEGGVFFIGHTDVVNSAVFSRGGTKVVTASRDQTARIWDAQTGKELLKIQHSDGLNSAVFSQDSAKVLAASDDKTASIWNFMTRKLVVTLKGHKGPVRTAVFNHDSTKALTASDDGTAIIWNAETGKVIRTLAVDVPVYCAVFSRDGKYVLTASHGNTVRIWNAETGNVVHTLFMPSGLVQTAVFNQDGNIVLTAHRDGTARTWNAATGEEIHTFRGHNRHLFTAKFSPDDKRVITASDDETGRIWNAETGEVVRVLLGHAGGVTSAEFSPDGSKLLTASDDKTARIWMGK